MCASSIGGKCLCPLGDFAGATPVLTSVHEFRADFDAHAKDKKAAAPAKPGGPRAQAARAAPGAKPAAARQAATHPGRRLAPSN